MQLNRTRCTFYTLKCTSCLVLSFDRSKIDKKDLSLRVRTILCLLIEVHIATFYGTCCKINTAQRFPTFRRDI